MRLTVRHTTTYRFETRVAGLPIRGRGEYTEFIPDRHIHDETTVASEGSFDWTFETEGDGVRVIITHHPGRYWGLPVIGRLLARNYEQMDRQVLARLRAARTHPGVETSRGEHHRGADLASIDGLCLFVGHGDVRIRALEEFFVYVVHESQSWRWRMANACI